MAKLTKTNYPRTEDGKLDATERYLRRFKARGLKMSPKTKASDYRGFINSTPSRPDEVLDHARYSKPNHTARAVPISLVSDAISNRTQSYLDKLLGKKADDEQD